MCAATKASTLKVFLVKISEHWWTDRWCVYYRQSLINVWQLLINVIITLYIWCLLIDSCHSLLTFDTHCDINWVMTLSFSFTLFLHVTHCLTCNSSLWPVTYCFARDNPYVTCGTFFFDLWYSLFDLRDSLRPMTLFDLWDSKYDVQHSLVDCDDDYVSCETWFVIPFNLEIITDSWRSLFHHWHSLFNVWHSLSNLWYSLF